MDSSGDLIDIKEERYDVELAFDHEMAAADVSVKDEPYESQVIKEEPQSEEPSAVESSQVMLDLSGNYSTSHDSESSRQTPMTDNGQRRFTYAPEKPFSCATCGAKFKFYFKLTQHEKRHSGLRPYSCKECGASFSQAGILKNHMGVHAEVRPYPCTHCTARFVQSGNLKRHMMSVHSGTESYECGKCGSSFSGRRHLGNHMKTHFSNISNPDPDSLKLVLRERERILQSAGLSSSVLKDNMADCSRIKLNERFVFGKIFQESTREVLQKTKDKRFVGNVSGVRVSQKGALVTSSDAANLKIHSRSHSLERPYKCEACGSTFSHLAAWTNHVRSHRSNIGSASLPKPNHSGETLPLKINEADQLSESTQVGNSDNHLQAHALKTCDKCGKRFAVTEDFLLHKCEKEIRSKHTAGESLGDREDSEERVACGTTSSDVLDFKCEDSLEDASDKTAFNSAHELPHAKYESAEGKPYVCYLCGAGFDQEGDFRAHERSHVEDKSCDCNVCVSLFGQA